MEERKKSAKKYIVIAIILMLISMIGASLVQSDGGRVTVKDIRFETSSGYRMSGLLFVPKGVSAENPAPAIVTSHGMFNNREMQDANFTELARRGFVVFSMDMLSHGNSDNVVFIGDVVTGMYQAVMMLDSLSYVDSSKIGITGHSLGGMSSNASVGIDNAMPTQLISSVLLNCADAEYKDEEGEFINMYGSRDVGIIAVKYDEFFMRDVDINGNMTPPRDFLKYNNAQSFLYFGVDPNGKDERSPETFYHENIDGLDCVRVIYNPEIIHPWSHFSQKSTAATIEYFDTSLGAPNPLPPSNQIWQLKEFFNFIGVVGILMFLVSFVTLMVHTPLFASLRAEEIVQPRKLDKKGRQWFWGSVIAMAIFGTLTYIPILKNCNSFTITRDPFQQSEIWGVSLWAMACGLFAVLCMVVIYNAYLKKYGWSPEEHGVAMPVKKFGKTILLALISVMVFYGWVFFADYFFKTDFRIWLLGIKAFEVDKILLMMLPYGAFFLIFYIANAVAVNSFNYNDAGKKGWMNTFILALFNVVPAAAILIVQYSAFRATGFMFINEEPTNMNTVWLFPFLAYLPISAILSRKMFRVTNNPYLSGIIIGLIITMIACSNTLTWL